MSEQQQNETIPNNHVVAVISGPAAAEAVTRELQQDGFDQLLLFRGNDIAETVDPKGENAGPLAKLVKAVQDHLSEEPNFLTQYQEEARNGNDVVAVQVQNKDQAYEVKEILERHGARNLRFFGLLSVTDLSPESNPSLRSADSPEPQSGV
ncbi:MAG: hypothetical protein GEU75_09225 [Dehalococcoidia bacterium]|nr:hypothetical protein [Dehalococcoidia bacterium]